MIIIIKNHTKMYLFDIPRTSWGLLIAIKANLKVDDGDLPSK